MTIRAVLFDLDDTLFDHQASATEGFTTFIHHLSSLPSESLLQCWFEVERTNYDRWLAGEISFSEQRRERLRQFLPAANIQVPTSEAELDEMFAIYLSHYEAAWTAFPDAADALRTLVGRGLMVSVLTNGNHVQQTQKIQRIGLGTLVHPIFSSESVGHAKPSVEAFLIPCESLQLSPQEVLYVGDNHRTDIEGARTAGLFALHLDRNNSGQGPHTLHTLAALPTLLKMPPSNFMPGRP